METTVFSIRLSQEEARRIDLLAALRGEWRQSVILAGVRRELETAPERPVIDRLVEVERRGDGTPQK